MTRSYHYNHNAPVNGEPIVRAWFRLLRERKWCLAELCRRAGIHARTPHMWRGKNSPRLATFIAALNVAGLDLAIVDSATGEVIAPTQEDGV